MIEVNDYENTKVFQSALRVIPSRLRESLRLALSGVSDKVQDVVLRSERPVCIYLGRKQMYLTKTGCLTECISSQELVKATVNDVRECFSASCGYSVYSHISEIKEGFITIKGGHRVGVSGTAVVSSGDIHNIRDISTVSVRFSRQIKGCGVKIIKDFVNSKGGLLVCGSPCSGKTTILRDMSRLLSTEYGGRVALVDSRGEIASSYNGVPQNDVGLSDVLDLYPRAQGIEQAVRCLSPEYIICDEIGSVQDAKALLQGVNCSVRFIASMHASDIEELKNRRNFSEIISTNAFEKIVFLRGREKAGEINKTVSIQELCCV